MKISEILEYRVKRVNKDLVFEYGDRSDGAIEFAGLVEGEIVEVGYFYGSTKSKNIILISSQIGCPVRCSFCPLGNDGGFVRNLTAEEMVEQAILMLQVAKQHSFEVESIGHKITFAKTGEPLLNPNIVSAIEALGNFGFSFKFSTIFPRGKKDRLMQVSKFARTYGSPIQLQISLVSTMEDAREALVGMKLASFKDMSEAGQEWKRNDPFDRKVNLSLMMTEGNQFDLEAAERFFPPDVFRFRLRIYMSNEHGKGNCLKTASTEEYANINEKLKCLGYEVGDWAVPTPMEQRFGLASNVTRSRYLKIISGKI